MKSNAIKRIAQKYGIHIVFGFAIIILLPVLLNLFPLYYSTPDIQYVKAKLYRVQMGEIYADPVTGFDNFHPPAYHLFLAIPALTGIPVDYILLLVTISNVLMIFFLLFKILAHQFEPTTALYTCLLIPFIVEYMGCGNLFLPTAFYFAIPFYLAGLWFFLPADRSTVKTILYAVFWGAAYLISPAYLFIIGLPMLYELLIRRDIRRFGIAFGIMMVVLIPFWHQAYAIFSQKLFGTSAFAFWRGFPDGEFFKTLAVYIINPTEKQWANPLVWAAFVLTVWSIITIVRAKAEARATAVKWYLLAGAIGYLLTFYHFKPQYAIRIHLFVSIFLLALYIHSVMSQKRINTIIIWVLIGIASSGAGYHLYKTLTQYRIQNERLPGIFQTCEKFRRVFPQFVSPDEYVLAFHGTYRHYILPYHPAHALKAYDSGEYFQLTSTLSAEYEKDYNLALRCDNRKCLDYICNKYNIKKAIVNAGDMKYPVFQYINANWQTVYSDPYFRIFQRP